MTTRTIADSPVHDPTYLSGLTLSVSIQSTSSETGGWALRNVPTSVSHPASQNHFVLVSLLGLGVRGWGPSSALIYSP